MPRRPALPKDPSQRAKAILDLATGATSDSIPQENPMSALGRAGGLKGGAARAAKLSPEKRRQIATNAARKRWKSK
jgi:hypothetical protein